MVAAVLVLSETGRLHDQGFHAAGGVGGWGMIDEGLVDVDVRLRRVRLENRGGLLRFDADLFGDRLQGEPDRHINWR